MFLAWALSATQTNRGLLDVDNKNIGLLLAPRGHGVAVADRNALLSTI